VTRFSKLSAEPDVWEYCQVDLNDLPRKTREVDLLNEVGEQGWELVAILHNHVAYLKRLATPAKPPRSPRTSRSAAKKETAK
jgi:hypothetical protein